MHKGLSLRSHLQTCPLNLVREYNFWLDTATIPHGIMTCKVSVSFVNPGCWVSRNLVIVGSQTFMRPQTELAVSQMCLSQCIWKQGPSAHMQCVPLEKQRSCSFAIAVVSASAFDGTQSASYKFKFHRYSCEQGDSKVTQYFWSARCRSIKEYPSASVHMHSFQQC